MVLMSSPKTHAPSVLRERLFCCITLCHVKQDQFQNNLQHARITQYRICIFSLSLTLKSETSPYALLLNSRKLSEAVM